MTLGARLFHAVTYQRTRVRSVDAELAYQDSSVHRFLQRFAPPLVFTGRTVLDIGCGAGALCIEAVRQGAAHATGVDLGTDLARVHLGQQEPEVAAKVTVVQTRGDLSELGDRRFDVILSKDSFEHYDDPDRLIAKMVEHLNPGGEVVIGFGPLWKSPTGGHIDYMTPLPWAQLLFPEHIIMAERRRFRPDEDARHWSEIYGGLNQMTLKRFRRIIAASGLQPAYFATNVSDNRVVKAMSAVGRVPGLQEYFTQSVYTVLRQPG